MPTYAELLDAFAGPALFDEKTWLLSPEAWPLTPAQVGELRAIGDACLEFHRALETLYLRSAEGKNLLRNKKLLAPWVAEYLDRGKPRSLVEHARSARQRRQFPTILRPDLLLAEDGFALTEIDSVPGGIGLTAQLNRIYAGPGSVPVEDPATLGTIVGQGDRMVTAFHETLVARVSRPGVTSPVIAILVSDEASTYRPEMDWLAEQLQRRGHRVHALHPSEVIPLGSTLNFDLDGSPERIDVVYRFWELFDLASVGRVGEFLLDAEASAEVGVAPPLRPFQEEKLAMALFHHHLLHEFWAESLSRGALKLLRRLIPRSWIVEDLDLPPTAVIDGPLVEGRPIWRWEQLGEASQKERDLILKISGFDESAWGARSVTYGRDVSREEWTAALREAVERSATHPYILQEYRKPARLRHPVFRGEGDRHGAPGEVRMMEGRLRLCPYYAVRGERTELIGALATFCPADKKIIHGMKDAAMLPVRVVEPSPAAPEVPA